MDTLRDGRERVPRRKLESKGCNIPHATLRSYFDAPIPKNPRVRSTEPATSEAVLLVLSHIVGELFRKLPS